LEKKKLNDAQRQIQFKARWDALEQRAADAQRAAFRNQYGYEAPGMGPIAPRGYP